MWRYNEHIERMRREEFPMLGDELYLDHAGTTLYSKRLLDSFHSEMISTLYGNPHSASSSSQRSMRDIDHVRTKVLELFHADPETFDFVFTSNTTAAIKIVVDAFRDHPADFRYGYHVDSHTSLIGVREASTEYQCLSTESEVDRWLEQTRCQTRDTRNLFAYPAQSNMNGRRLPLDWTMKMKAYSDHHVYSLLDAAAFAPTSPLCLDSMEVAPDFTVVSFSKIFGFPDLGGLIIRKTAGHLFKNRKYFGGGTVDMVVCLEEKWHIKKSESLHDQLEDGTLPIHNIVALKCAMRAHKELFKSLEEVARHTTFLTHRLRSGLMDLRHGNHQPVCTIYKAFDSTCNDKSTPGPTIAFNLKDHRGTWISNAEFEKLALIKNIHLRTGGLCNPGGVASSLGLAPWEMKENFSAGFRCGSENDIMNDKPTGVIRVSLGAMSTVRDVDRFLSFVQEFFVNETPLSNDIKSSQPIASPSASRLYVESLTVYPIKSCSGWQIPHDKPWEVHREGLAWDREWCLVQQPGGTALSQKNNRRMALIRPELDFEAGLLRIRVAGSPSQISVPLSHDPRPFDGSRTSSAKVCGDPIEARVYTSPAITEFFTSVLGLPCTLARFPSANSSRGSSSSSSSNGTKGRERTRHSKPHLYSSTLHASSLHPLLLSNESPILTISRSSLNHLNDTIRASGGRPAPHTVFRANIVLAEDGRTHGGGSEGAWAEDAWDGMWVGGNTRRSEPDEEGEGGGGGGGEGSTGAASPPPVEFDFLGGCRRCQMVCVDPESGERHQEPFVTLAKTRRFHGRVLFGVHTALAGGSEESGPRGGRAMIRVGDAVVPYGKKRDG